MPQPQGQFTLSLLDHAEEAIEDRQVTWMAAGRGLKFAQRCERGQTKRLAHEIASMVSSSVIQQDRQPVPAGLSRRNAIPAVGCGRTMA